MRARVIIRRLITPVSMRVASRALPLLLRMSVSSHSGCYCQLVPVTVLAGSYGDEELRVGFADAYAAATTGEGLSPCALGWAGVTGVPGRFGARGASGCVAVRDPVKRSGYVGAARAAVMPGAERGVSSSEVIGEHAVHGLQIRLSLSGFHAAR